MSICLVVHLTALVKISLGSALVSPGKLNKIYSLMAHQLNDPKSSTIHYTPLLLNSQTFWSGGVDFWMKSALTVVLAVSQMTGLY